MRRQAACPGPVPLIHEPSGRMKRGPSVSVVSAKPRWALSTSDLSNQLPPRYGELALYAAPGRILEDRGISLRLTCCLVNRRIVWPTDFLPGLPRAALKKPDVFLLRAALKTAPRDHQSPTANRQPPTAANCHQPLTANCQPLK